MIKIEGNYVIKTNNSKKFFTDPDKANKYKKGLNQVYTTLSFKYLNDALNYVNDQSLLIVSKNNEKLMVSTSYYQLYEQGRADDDIVDIFYGKRRYNKLKNKYPQFSIKYNDYYSRQKFQNKAKRSRININKWKDKLDHNQRINIGIWEKKIMKERKKLKKGQAIAYVDGSYHSVHGKHIYAVIFISRKSILYYRITETPKAKNKKYKQHYSELSSSIFAMKLAIQYKIKDLVIVHDNNGIVSIAEQENNIKNEINKKYKEFYDLASLTVNIKFKQVRAHNGNAGNELVDSLASISGY